MDPSESSHESIRFTPKTWPFLVSGRFRAVSGDPGFRVSGRFIEFGAEVNPRSVSEQDDDLVRGSAQKGPRGRVVAKQGEASDDASQTEFKMSWNSTTWHFSVRGQCEAKLKLSSYPDPWSTDFAAEFHAHTAFSLCHVLAITSRTCRTHPTLDSSFDDEVEGFVRRIPSPTWRPGPR